MTLEYMIAEAKEEGLEQGRTEGLEQGRLEMARTLKDKGISIDIIAEASGLSKEEIDKL